MNPEAREELDRILALDLHELTEGDRAFLRARRPYLNKEQQEVYAKVLNAPIDKNGQEVTGKKVAQEEEVEPKVEKEEKGGEGDELPKTEASDKKDSKEEVQKETKSSKK